MAIKQALEAAFAPIEQDTTLLERCYVKTRESEEAADHLARMALVPEHKLIDAAEDYPKRVKEQIPRREDGNALTTLAREPGFLARIVGQSSSGKSVFLSRFFRIDLKADHRKHVFPAPHRIPHPCRRKDSARRRNRSRHLAKYIVRASFSQERMVHIPGEKSPDGSAKAACQSKDGRTGQTFDALDWLARLVVHIQNRYEQLAGYVGL